MIINIITMVIIYNKVLIDNEKTLS